MTTTIRLEDDLRQRVISAAERAGQTAHAFMLDAIARSVEQAEQEAEFRSVANERWARVRATGATVPWDDAKAYLLARAGGQGVKKPAARKLKA